MGSQRVRLSLFSLLLAKATTGFFSDLHHENLQVFHSKPEKSENLTETLIRKFLFESMPHLK